MNFYRKITSEVAESEVFKILHSSIGDRIRSSASWSLIGSVASRALALFASIVVARILGVNEYGRLAAVQATSALAVALLGTIIIAAATKYIAESRSNSPQKACKILGGVLYVAAGLSLIGSILVKTQAAHLATMMGADPSLESAIEASALLVGLSLWTGTQQSILAGLEGFKALGVLTMISGIIAAPLSAIGAKLGGVEGAICGAIAAQCAACILGHQMIKGELTRQGLHINFKIESIIEVLAFVKYSLPAFISGSLISFSNWYAIFLLSSGGQRFNQIGILNAANQWYGAVIYLPSVLGQAAFPLFAERSANGSPKEQSRLLKFYLIVNVLSVVPVVTLGIALRDKIMGAYGEEIGAESNVLVAVLITSAIVAIQTPLGQMMAAKGQMWRGLAMNALWAFAFIAPLVATDQISAWNVATTRLVAYGILFLITCYWLRNLLIGSEPQRKQATPLT